jgi:hypothetical protein
MPFSRKTHVRLAEVMGQALGHGQLDNMFYEYDAVAADPAPNHDQNRMIRSLALIRTISARPDQNAADADLREVITTALANPFYRSAALLASLAVDGYEWANDRLVAAMPVPVPLQGEITQLEAVLENRGFAEAKRHYEQAVDSFTDGRFEAGNGQLRSFLESLLPALGRAHGAQDNVGPDAAILHLHRNNDLDNAERDLFRALWSGVQDDGPHAGLADEDEARFRLHAATASAMYLLTKIQ